MDTIKKRLTKANWLKDEQGFSTFMTAVMLMGALLAAMLVLFWPNVKLYGYQQAVQTATDAATQAAMEQRAQDLTQEMVGIAPWVPYIGDCWEFPDDVRKKAAKVAWGYYYFLHIPLTEGNAEDQANYFAALNRGNVADFASKADILPIPPKYLQFQAYFDDVEMWFPPVITTVKGSRSMEIGGQLREVPARATAATYLANVELSMVLPIYEPPYCIRFAIWQRYTWQSRMVIEE